MAIFTNAGLTLIATAMQTNGAQVAPTYAAISAGCGVLASPVSSGVPITSLPMTLGIPSPLASGQSLTVTDGTNSETVTTSGPVSALATSIPINSWNPVHNYAANTTGVAPTPQATDLALYAEYIRVPCNPGTGGSNPGESLVTAYFDGTQLTSVYLLIGYFGGSANASVGTGTLIAEDTQYWNHTVNVDSSNYQLDATI